jgi:hypothetical protein
MKDTTLLPRLSVSILLIFALFACNQNQQQTAGDSESTDAEILEIKAAHNMVDGDAEHLFQLSMEEIPSGWTTLRFVNSTHTDHFFILYDVPESGTEAAEEAGQSLVDHWHENIIAPFQREWNPYIAGDLTWEEFVDNLFAAVLAGAPWFVDVLPAGGPGITSAGEISETVIHLEPGTYIAECYVKDKAQEFHSYNGMLAELTVTQAGSEKPEPDPTLDIALNTPENGAMQVPEAIPSGEQMVAIHYQDQSQYEHLVGHNAQLVRFDNGYNDELLEELNAWMDWTTEAGMTYRAPEGTKFLGGAMQMQPGKIAYFSVDLQPEDYAWVAEVPDPAAKGMLHIFSVTE